MVWVCGVATRLWGLISWEFGLRRWIDYYSMVGCYFGQIVVAASWIWVWVCAMYWCISGADGYDVVIGLVWCC